MKIKLLIVTFAAFFVFTGSASKSFAQDIPMPGSYSSADAKSRDVVAAAEFAAKTQGKKQKSTIRIVSINTAKTQVVAGMNFQICMKVSVKRKSGKVANQLITAVVYRDLQNKFELTNWSPVAEGSSCEAK